VFEEGFEGPVQAFQYLLSCLRVELPQQRVGPPLGSEDPTLLAVRGGEPFLLPAPLPVGEGFIPELPPGLDHPQEPPLLLAVWVQTELERRLHAIQKIIRSHSI